MKVSLTGNDQVQQETQDIIRRANDMSPTDAAVRDAVVRQNAAENFDPTHPLSLLEVDAGDGAIGSKVERYAELLRVDDEEIADIIDKWFDTGAT